MSRSVCKLSIHRFRGARYERFTDCTAAGRAWNHAREIGTVGPLVEGLATSDILTSHGRILSDHEVYYTVLKGVRPGVYFGR